MSRYVDQLHHTIVHAEQVLVKVPTGTAEKVRHVPRVVLAAERIEKHLPGTSPRLDDQGETGGSSSPREVDDRAEENRVAIQAILDDARIKELCKTADEALRELYRLVIRNTEVIDHTKLPTDDTVPGCMSCARRLIRKGVTVGGHFAPVVDEPTAEKVRGKAAAAVAIALRLCRGCWDNAVANADLDGRAAVDVTSADFPPIEWCDRLHRQGAQAAGRWLAKQRRRAA